MSKEELSEKLIYPLFRCLAEDYKVKYVRNIWEQFENGIRSAAYTGRLTAFLENITSILPIDIQAKYMKDVLSVIQSGDDENILNWLRDETTYLVLLARIENQNRKETFV